MQWAVDAAKSGYEARASGDLGAADLAVSAVLRYSIVIAVLALVIMGMQMVMRWMFSSMARYVEYDMRQKFFERLLTLSLAYYQKMPTGDLMARATNDISAVRMYLAFGLRMILTASLALPFSLIVMLTIDWKLALIALVPMPIMVLVMNRIAGRVNVGFRGVQEQFSTISARIQENLSGIRVVKAYVRRHSEEDYFRGLNDEFLKRNRALIHIEALLDPFMFLVSSASLLLVLWLGGQKIIDGTFTLGAFVAFNAYLTRLVFPMITLGWMIDRFQRGMASMKRIDEILDAKPDIYTLPSAERDAAIRGAVTFRGVHLNYGDAVVLQDINLTIPAGGSLAIVGRVGSGKTSLARLIPRLIECSEGEVLIDGKPVQAYDLDTLRGAIGYVPQDTFLFSDSIHENVLFGVASGDVEKVNWAADISQLSRDIADFPDGLDTVMGERGVTLSGGQKQRTALSRAVIRRPSILILDDAMASVDTHTEDEILKRLRGVMADRTTILIAHRISTVKDADHIIVMEEGRIIEQGSHAALLEINGSYAAMYRQQQLRDEIGEL